MSKIIVEKTVSRPVADVWEAISDFGGIYKFHPAVARSPLKGAQAGGIGAQRTCHFHDGNHVVEKVVGWEEGKSMEVNIVEGSMPLNCAEATIAIHEDGPSQTTVTFTIGYEPKFGPVGRVMDVLMMRGQFRKMIGGILDGLDTFLATGKVIGRDGQPEAGTAAA